MMHNTKRTKKNISCLAIGIVLCIYLGLFFTGKPTHATNEAYNANQMAEALQVTLNSVTISDIPPFSQEAYIYINNNIPDFSNEDKENLEAFESYGELDYLGRCSTAYANICRELMPTEERQEIGSIKPTGWHTVKYNDIIDGNYLYNRCHLIGYQLAGENANEKNLITGTRYLNVVGMLEFENIVSNYVQNTDNHVLYRVTPWFEGENLVAAGVQMEAWSVEDNGEGVCFNVFCYNVQPGIEIDYATGESRAIESSLMTETANETKVQQESELSQYVINKNTKKFHLPDCSSVTDMAEHNKCIVNDTASRLIIEGYSPCKRCLKAYQ